MLMFNAAKWNWLCEFHLKCYLSTSPIRILEQTAVEVVKNCNKIIKPSGFSGRNPSRIANRMIYHLLIHTIYFFKDTWIIWNFAKSDQKSDSWQFMNKILSVNPMCRTEYSWIQTAAVTGDHWREKGEKKAKKYQPLAMFCFPNENDKFCTQL